MNTGTRIQGVDDHLAVDRAGNFHAAIGKHRGNGGHSPVCGADRRGRDEEVRFLSGVESRLAHAPRCQQVLPLLFKLLVELGEKIQGRR